MLEKLVEDLQLRGPLDRGPAEMGRILAATADSLESLRTGLLFQSGVYTRNCYYANDTFEILLLNWDAGATSPVHDHGDQHCWLIVLEGRLLIDDYVRLDRGETPGRAHVEARDSRMLGSGGLDLRSGRFDLHRVTATTDAPAVSLHVYSRPMRRFLVYDENEGRCEIALGNYDAVLSTSLC